MFFNQFGEKVFPLIPNALGSEFLHVLFGLCSETKAKILIAHELSQCFGQTFGGGPSHKKPFSPSLMRVFTPGHSLHPTDGKP